MLLEASEMQSYKPKEKNITVYTPGIKMTNYSHDLSVDRHNIDYFSSPVSVLEDTN